MITPLSPAWTRRGWPLLDGLVLFGGFMLAFAAFDDITTDASAPAFVAEYVCLTAVAAACAVVGLRLIRAGRNLPGWLSLAMLAAGIWAQRGIGPGTRPNLGHEYLTVAAVATWFLVLSCKLISLGLREIRQKRA
jgi:hypothetical protein